MKTVILSTIIFLTLILPISVIAGWNDPDKGCFKYKKDLENDVSDESKAATSIYFNKTIFHFINYGFGDQVVIRRITPGFTGDSITSWTVIKDDHITHLNTGLGNSKWQPAPVIFNETLLLFLETEDLKIAYSVYDQASNTWSTFTAGPTGCDGEFMAAVVVIDKLCLIARDKSSGMAAIYWTKDLVQWHSYQTGITCGQYTAGTSYKYYYHISAISKTWLDPDQQLNNKIMVSYLTGDKYARVAEFAFNASENLYPISDELVTSDYTVNSAVLAEGTVVKDASTGVCTQIFLKKSTKDNGYCRYRILRYQKKEGQTSWTKQENNLVPQNKLWADKDLDLTVVNYPFLATVSEKSKSTKIKQSMCLIYRGYDDWDHPLNVAWAETDHMVYVKTDPKTLDSPSQLQYLGYIEGPPPYYLNPPCDNTPDDYYDNCEDENISELEYTHSSGTSQDTTLGFDIKRTLKMKVAGFTLGLTALAGEAKGVKTQDTKSTSTSVKAGDDPTGHFLTLHLIILRDTYDVYDVHGNLLYKTYYFHLEEDWQIQLIPLRSDLVPGHPETYMNDSTISYYSYDMFEPNSVSWSKDSPGHSSVGIDNEESITCTNSGTAELGKEFGEFLDLGVEGSFDYELKTTTMTSNEMTAWCRMNNPDEANGTDVAELYYDVFWLRKTDGMPNWWLNEYCQDPGQQPWCLTYLVTMIVYVNGDTLQLHSSYSSLGIDDNLALTTPLVQNRPNPFSSVTTISYRVGTEAEAVGNGPWQLTTLAIYDLNGRLVATPVNETKAPGTYEVTWDASSYPAGIYLCRLQTGDGSYVRKLVVTR